MQFQFKLSTLFKTYFEIMEVAKERAGN